MLSNHRQLALLGLWTGLIAVIVTASVALGANLSTTAFLLALSAAPVIVMAMLASHAPASSVAEILYAVTKDSRR